MIRCGLLFLLFVIPATAAVGQTLTMHKRFGGVRFEYKKDTTVITVSPKQVADILSVDPLASEEFKKARANYSAAGVIGFAGGFMIGFPIGTAIAGGEPEWGLAAGGVALLLATIPLTNAFNHHAQSAIDGFNERHASLRPRWNYWVSGSGAGLVYTF